MAKRKMVVCSCAPLCRMGTSEVPPISRIRSLIHMNGKSCCLDPLDPGDPLMAYQVVTCSVAVEHTGTQWIRMVEVTDE
jgi:hypothetical protein